MRCLYLFSTTLLCIASLGLADDRGAASTDPTADKILAEWSSRSKEIRSFYAEYDLCLIQGDSEIRIPGAMRFLSPCMARQDCLGERPSSLILTGDASGKNPRLFYNGDEEAVPNGLSGAALLQHHMLPFMFLPDLPLAKRYYRMELLAATEAQAHFVMWRHKDRLPPDQEGFIVEEVEVLLDRKTYIPQQIRIGSPKSNHMVYEIKGAWTNVEISQNDFAAPLRK